MKLITASDLLFRYHGKADSALQQRAQKAVELLEEVAQPDCAKAVFCSQITASGLIINGIALPGCDIANHIKGYGLVAVCACTLGAEADKLIERLKLTDLALAYLVDQAASLAVDSLAEQCWREVCAQAKNGYTTRFSCGYGDFDLSFQPKCLALCGADKSLGIRINEGGMMYPTKTITFLCGF